jgi:endonuclease/exonuclease/phosphatase family metal-dependent hydrolase
MQNLWRLIILSLFLGSATAGEVVRVVTWNLKWFPGQKPAATQEERDRHFLEVAAVIPQFRADVIILQEVRNHTVAEQLAQSLPGFTVHVTSQFKDTFNGTVGDQQISIMSRYSADGAWAAAWKRGWANAPRGYAYARVIIKGKPLHLYGLHLKSNLGDPAANTSKREDAIEQLIEHVDGLVQPHEAVVVAGDFNTSNDQVPFAADRTLTKLGQAGFFWTFEGVPHEDRITIPGMGRYPDACFDHIFTRGLGRPVSQVLRDTPGSDHFPVVVDLVLEDGPAPAPK